jgi:hypothetical protein
MLRVRARQHPVIPLPEESRRGDVQLTTDRHLAPVRLVLADSEYEVSGVVLLAYTLM